MVYSIAYGIAAVAYVVMAVVVLANLPRRGHTTLLVPAIGASALWAGFMGLVVSNQEPALVTVAIFES